MLIFWVTYCVGLLLCAWSFPTGLLKTSRAARTCWTCLGVSSLLTTACSMLKAYWSCGGRERACCKVCQGLKPRCHLRVLAGQRCNSGLGLQSKRTNSKVSYALRALHNDLRPAGYALVMSPWQRVPSFGCAITQAFVLTPRLTNV